MRIAEDHKVQNIPGRIPAKTAYKRQTSSYDQVINRL